MYTKSMDWFLYDREHRRERVKAEGTLTGSFLGILQHFSDIFAIKVTPPKEKSKWLFLYSDFSKKCF